MARRTDIDWLRVIATYLLFVFHVGKVFDPAPFFHVRNDQTSFVFLVLCGFMHLWHMPLFFVLAGWSAVASLERRGPGGFVRERLLRLGVPLVVGSALFGPVMKYVELRSGLDANAHGLRVGAAVQESFRQVIPSGLGVAPPFDEMFREFLPTFFTHLDRFTWGHLWFIAYLLVFTLALLPLLTWLVHRAPEVRRVPAGWVYAPVVPLALVQVFLRPYWPGLQNLYDDWANVGFYATCLLAGFLIGRFPAIEARVHAEWRRALAVAVVTTLGLLLAVLGVVQSPSAILAGTALAGWCYIVAFLGIAHRAAPARTARLDHLAESAFPVYILHQPAIIVLGYFVVLPLALGVAAKFGLLLVASVVVTVATYHFAIRPFTIPRVLFGMKPRARALRLPTAAHAAGALLGLALLARAAVAAPTPVGTWYAEGGAAQVAIDRCGDRLCGRVVWLRSPFDEEGCELRDRWNPDPALRDRPVIGLEILRGLERSSARAGAWSGGEIYDPTSGRTYRCEITPDGEDRLLLRGYLGVRWLGRTTRWIRVGTEEQLCRAAGR